MVTCRSVLVSWAWAAATRPQVRVVRAGAGKGVEEQGWGPDTRQVRGGSREHMGPRSWRRRMESRFHCSVGPNKDRVRQGGQPRCYVPSRQGQMWVLCTLKGRISPPWPSFSGRVTEVKGQERGPSSPLPTRSLGRTGPLPRAPVYSLPQQGGGCDPPPREGLQGPQ